MTEDEYEKWVRMGLLPLRAFGHTINLHKIERALRTETEASRRVALLKRLLEHR